MIPPATVVMSQLMLGYSNKEFHCLCNNTMITFEDEGEDIVQGMIYTEEEGLLDS